jgi:DNA-binding SARP family transcriptional activator
MLTIRLLGPPAIEREGRPVPPPRGRKAWALLAYVLLAERPASRRHLAGLLFGDANDPLGALRWTLAELRRALGIRPLTGDPIAIVLGDEVCVDLHLLTRDMADPEPLLHLGGELLEGVDLAANLEFESWLLVARHRVSATIEARLREAAITLLAAGHAADAVAYASRAVARNPLEEGNHELLVRSLAMAGDRTAALRQVAVCEDVLRADRDTPGPSSTGSNGGAEPLSAKTNDAVAASGKPVTPPPSTCSRCRRKPCASSPSEVRDIGGSPCVT